MDLNLNTISYPLKKEKEMLDRIFKFTFLFSNIKVYFPNNNFSNEFPNFIFILFKI